MFVFHDGENQNELVPAMRHLSSFITLFNEKMKSGQVLSLAVSKSISYLEKPNRRQDIQYTLYMVINCSDNLKSDFSQLYDFHN